MELQPLIVTAELPPPIFAWADALRRAHFPPERNHLAAHVTLFHAIPATAHDELAALLESLAASHASPPARLAGLMSLGGGTALRIESPEMQAIRTRIAEPMDALLTRQDRHAKHLHVTIQNKVTSAEAKALQRQLVVSDHDFAFSGLALHRYLGPAWQALARWSFAG